MTTIQGDTSQIFVMEPLFKKKKKKLFHLILKITFTLCLVWDFEWREWKRRENEYGKGKNVDPSDRFVNKFSTFSFLSYYPNSWKDIIFLPFSLLPLKPNIVLEKWRFANCKLIPAWIISLTWCNYLKPSVQQVFEDTIWMVRKNDILTIQTILAHWKDI